MRPARTAALAPLAALAVAPLARRAASAALIAVVLMAAPAFAAAGPRWQPPAEGPPTRLFAVGPDPFAPGQHRGVDFAAPGPVRAACAGVVVFAGTVAGEGTVSERCGRWRVSYAPLRRIEVREGHWIGAGAPLGRAAALLHFGVRHEGERFGYVDPLPFLTARRAPPVTAPPPAEARRRITPPPRTAPSPGHAGRRVTPPPRTAPSPARARLRTAPPPHAAAPHARARAPILRARTARAHAPPTLAPWPVWLGLALLLTGLAGAGRLRLPFRRQEAGPCRASSTSSSSPMTPSSR
jgi:hypothetical protein